MKVETGDKQPAPRSLFPKVAIAAVLLFLLVMAVVALSLRLPPEPSYNGRSLSQWLVDLDYSQRPADLAASNAVRHIGVKALPHLGPMLRAHDSPFKIRLLRLISKTRLIRFPYIPADALRQRAARACQVLGPPASQYLPELTAMLDSKNTDVAWSGYAAILETKPPNECVPELTRAITNNSPLVRAHAVGMLGSLKTQDPLVIATVMRTLGDRAPDVRQRALYALHQLLPESPESLNRILGHLDDPDASVRYHALQLLIKLKPTSPSAKDRLLKCSLDASPRVRTLLLANYRAAGLDDTALLQMADTLVDDPDAHIRLLLTGQLGRLSPSNTQARALLQRCLKDENPRVRTVAQYHLNRQP